MAHVFIDAAAHHEAETWYRAGRGEPAGGAGTLPIGPVRSITHMTLSSLLDAMAAIPPGGSATVVCHGRDQGIALPLIPGDTVRARADVMGMLAADTAHVDSGIPVPAMTDAELAPVLLMPAAQIRALRVKMNQVRGLHLAHVAFRACNMGQWQHALSAYHRFFGAQVSAPNLRDTYGFLDPGAPLANPETTPPRRGAPHGAGWHLSSYEAGGGTVRIATAGGESDSHAYHVDLAYDSLPALTAWRTQYATPGSDAGRFAYHGAWLTSAAPGAHRILFVGDPDYARHIVVG